MGDAGRPRGTLYPPFCKTIFIDKCTVTPEFAPALAS
jgi:hypothetical protein